MLELTHAEEPTTDTTGTMRLPGGWKSLNEISEISDIKDRLRELKKYRWIISDMCRLSWNPEWINLQKELRLCNLLIEKYSRELELKGKELMVVTPDDVNPGTISWIFAQFGAKFCDALEVWGLPKTFLPPPITQNEIPDIWDSKILALRMPTAANSDHFSITNSK